MLDNSINFRQGVFVSDLHLFSPRSAADTARRSLIQFDQAEQCIVLGGDIFDLRWSTHGSHEATLDAAQNWLERLLAETGEARIHFLAGNHDAHPELLRRLELLAKNQPRFAWSEHSFRIADTLFLHGDILDASGDLITYRRKFEHVRPQSQLSHRAYDAAVGMRLHKLVPLVRHQPLATCKRLLQLTQASQLFDTSGIDRIFFGHTHVPMHGLQLSKVRFFNPGAALRHMRYHMQTFEF